MHKLSVIIPTYNEQEHIAPLLQLLTWADEIIVIDSFSTDDTVKIATKMGAKIVQRKYINSANQKNWIIPQAQHQWIFLLDADERPTPKLIKEIKDFLSADNPENYTSFWINRQNYFMGKHIQYSGWQNDAVIRLFKRDQCRYEEKNVHAEIISKGKVGRLKEPLEHYTLKDMNHFLAKMRRYAKWSAQDYAPKTPKVTLFHLLLKPFFRFFKHYILKLGILDGRAGLVISALMAWGVFLRYVYIHEQQASLSS